MTVLTRFLALPFLAMTLSAAPELSENEARIAITIGEVEVLTYHKAESEAPEQAGEIYNRSAFIEPLRNSRGHAVTDRHPTDHWHHMGLWHPWTHTVIDGRNYDFWNLNKGEGTVRFAEATRVLESPDGGGVGFVARQNHVMLKPQEAVAIEEELTVIVRDSAEPFIVDYSWTQTPQVDIELPPHRYGGGLGYRGRRDWTTDNLTVLTSEGKDREDGHATRARWVRYTGPDNSGEDTSVVLMNAPTNHDHPQRVRIHPQEPFFCYTPQQENAWELKKGEPVTMAYRILVYAGTPSPDELEEQWRRFAAQSK
ncbi:PmoA family protein [Roseibacillus ishigakijimensis]|uniref:PmoA family protein n=1 Tax=Roseibacillus ishigakijimensis TaxID=454146 RepID=A0A934RWA7_9BACT|nr:PmoA family protein [Roseibacillus ishigakijimensis]MBK1835611.1 PmoA family protein [Roseibacillus ishigakijimensis]